MSTFQFNDKQTSHNIAARQNWMRLLSRAPMEILEPALNRFAGPQPQWLRVPETGLIMAQGRVGGTGARFNLGEVTVTRCALRTDHAVVDCNAVGVAYVLGRSHRHAELAAIADALLQDPACSALLPANLLTRIEDWLATRRTARANKARSTKVEFFTVAREAGSAAETEDEE